MDDIDRLLLAGVTSEHDFALGHANCIGSPIGPEQYRTPSIRDSHKNRLNIAWSDLRQVGFAAPRKLSHGVGRKRAPKHQPTRTLKRVIQRPPQFVRAQRQEHGTVRMIERVR